MSTSSGFPFFILFILPLSLPPSCLPAFLSSSYEGCENSIYYFEDSLFHFHMIKHFVDSWGKGKRTQTFRQRAVGQKWLRQLRPWLLKASWVWKIRMLFFFTVFKHLLKKYPGQPFLGYFLFFCPYKHLHLEKSSYFQIVNFYLDTTLLKIEIVE